MRMLCSTTSVIKFVTLAFLLTAKSYAQDQLSIVLGDIQSGPSEYYSPEAYSYFSLRGRALPVQPEKESALRSYRAAIKLGKMGTAGSAAVPVLLERFPRAIHVTEVVNARYAGEGTFEDWIHTYITNEKNKFLFASPFLDYNSMSLCENHIETAYETVFTEKKQGGSGKIISALVNITITFTVHFGSCALEHLTGQSLGNDLSAWNEWWEQGGESSMPRQSVVPVVTGAALSSGQSFADIVVKGKYRMSLTTGDELIGIVESRDDTSLILETIEGKPYAFRQALIRRYELLELPKQKKSGEKESSTQADASREVTFDELQKMPKGSAVAIRISNGSIFKGSMISVDHSMVRVSVEGSEIPISREVVKQITLLVDKNEHSGTASKEPKKTGPFDTVYVKNPETDEWGKGKPDLLYTGIISKEDAQTLSLELLDGTVKQISRADVMRIIKHSGSSFDEPIKAYAKPLFCPEDMFLVDMPPGKQGRPFFKVCVDRYEYPNKKGAVPQSAVSFEQAKSFCEKQGKRLCSEEEWQWACSGLEGYTYPYGWNRDDLKCNTDGARLVETSGARLNCVSKFGGYDMVGNIFEWVTGKNSEPMLMGGPYSKCQTISPGVGGAAKASTGLRCCKSN